MQIFTLVALIIIFAMILIWAIYVRKWYVDHRSKLPVEIKIQLREIINYAKN